MWNSCFRILNSRLAFFPFLSSIEKNWHWDYTSRISEDSSRDSYHVNWKTKEKSRILFSKEIWLSGGHFLGKNGAFFSGFENEWILNLEVTEFRPTYRVFKQVWDRLRRKGDLTWIFSLKCPKSNSKLSLTPCICFSSSLNFLKFWQSKKPLYEDFNFHEKTT